MPILGQRGGTEGLPNILITETRTLTLPFNLECYAYVIGAGGSGGSVGSGGSSGSASGGSAGGTAVSRLFLSSGTNYTCTVGNGGTYVGGSGVTAGNDGQDTVFSGSDIATMTGTLGKGGATGGVSGGASQATQCATPTGGNVANIKGGRSKATTGPNKVTGGGAVGLYDEGLTGSTEATASDWADGGNLSGAPESVTATDLRQGYLTGYVAGAPFPDIYSVTASDMRGYSNYNTSALTSDTYDVGVSAQTAGVQPYMLSGKDVIWSNNAKSYNAPPFSGGNGLWTTAGYGYGSHGTLGGGGGAVRAVTEAYSGCGGTGAILLFPIAIS